MQPELSSAQKSDAWWRGLADVAAGDARRYADQGAKRPAFISARVAIKIYERQGDPASLTAKQALLDYLFARLGARP